MQCLLIGLILILIYLLFRNKDTLTNFRLTKYNSKEINNTEYEYPEQLALEKHLRPDDVVLQLGGNIGTSCIAAEQFLSEDSKRKSYCVEPSKKLISLLTKNKNRNNAKFNIVPKFISEKCNLELKYFDGDKDLWASQNLETNKLNDDCISLYKLPYHEEINVLFADCEGCICRFVDEYKDFINRQIRLIILEVDAREICDYNKITKIFKNMGFRLDQRGQLAIFVR